MKKLNKEIIAAYNGTTILHLNNEDIELIVRLLHQELDAVHGIIERNQPPSMTSSWLDRADHIQDLIIELTK